MEEEDGKACRRRTAEILRPVPQVKNDGTLPVLSNVCRVTPAVQLERRFPSLLSCAGFPSRNKTFKKVRMSGNHGDATSLAAVFTFMGRSKCHWNYYAVREQNDANVT
ncbi:uncharacterized protein LOC144083843 isoform X1 [Stigmatopora argus]